MNVHESSQLTQRLHERIRIHRDVEVVLAPSILALQPLSLQIDRRKFRLASQNAHWEDEGAFTGETSFSSLREIAHYGIIGHSDRRYKFGETLDNVRDKVAAAVRNGIVPILCVGETITEKVNHDTGQVIHDQVTTALSNLTAEDVEHMVIAYEPVWALSNGSNFRDVETPTPDIIEKVVKDIRHNVAELYGQRSANNLRVLYGGSTHSGTAGGFLNISGIDGLLVGGASMDFHEFSKMVEIAAGVAASRS